jgi:hypothetical protein
VGGHHEQHGADVNLKIWNLEDRIRDTSLSDEEVGCVTRTLTPLNEERSRLKNRINELTGLGSHDPKVISNTTLQRYLSLVVAPSVRWRRSYYNF